MSVTNADARRMRERCGHMSNNDLDALISTLKVDVARGQALLSAAQIERRKGHRRKPKNTGEVHG